MARAIVKGGSGNALTYTLGQTQSFSVESIAATVDASALTLGPSTAVDAIFRDNAGFLIARSRSSTTLSVYPDFAITFAPWLPDTQELGNVSLDNVITTGLCATTLPPGGSVTVQVVDPGGIVKGFHMWVEDAGAGIDGLNRDLDETRKKIPNPVLVVTS